MTVINKALHLSADLAVIIKCTPGNTQFSTADGRIKQQNPANKIALQKLVFENSLAGSVGHQHRAKAVSPASVTFDMVRVTWEKLNHETSDMISAQLAADWRL